MENYKIVFVLITFLLSSFNLYSKDEFPGLIQSLEIISNLNQSRLEKKMQSLAKTTSLEKNIAPTEDLFIDPSYFQSLVMNSDLNYLSVAIKNECQFYAYLENDLIKTSKKSALEKSGFIPAIKFDGIKYSFELMKKENFLNALYRKKCFQNKEMGKLFSLAFYKKTLSNLKFNIPKNTTECHSTFNEWRNNHYLPYLCKISEESKIFRRVEMQYANTTDLDTKRSLKTQMVNSSAILKDVPLLQKTFLENLCNNLEKPDNFCNKYLGKDAWHRITNGEIPSAKLNQLCQAYLKKTTVNIQDLVTCAGQFLENPRICNNIMGKDYLALFPRPDCDEISDALSVSQLNYKTSECPGLIDNESVTLVSRIINHYKPRNYVSTPKNCHNEVLATFANLNFEFKFKQAWPLEMCYKDRVESEEVCKTYIPGDDQTNTLSESVVLSKILNKQYNTNSTMNCVVTDESKFNPALLEFKNGCYIVQNKKQCTSFKCDKKIVVNGREITDIKYKGIPLFDTIPNSFSNEGFALINLVSDYLKITSNPVRNLTELKFFLTSAPGRIIVGIGCSEDILPQIFRKNSLNQCTPLSFILDGIQEVKDNTYLSVRTSIDEINTPRFINWHLIYNGVSSFREVHPLGTWALYGLK